MRRSADETGGYQAVASPARWRWRAGSREIGFPLTLNAVMHRRNLDRLDETIATGGETWRPAAGGRLCPVPWLGAP